MADISFYGVNSDVIKVLISLLDKTMSLKDINSVVAIKNPQELENIDKSLWSRHQWLPHCIVEDEKENENKIVLTLIKKEGEELIIKNNPTYLFILEDTPTPQISSYEKIFVIFNMNDSNILNTNRHRWKKLIEFSSNKKFFKQTEEGKFLEIKI